MLFWFGGQPVPDTQTVAGRVTVVGVIAIDAWKTVKAMLALFDPASVTVIVVAPAAKPVGMVNCRLFTWPAPLLLVTEPVTAVPPSVTVTVELAAKPAPYTVTEFPGLAWLGVSDVIAGLTVTALPPVE